MLSKIIGAVVLAGLCLAPQSLWARAAAPFEYTIASTVTLIRDGKPESQTLVSRCKAKPTEDGPVHKGQYGEPHWISLPGNSIGVLYQLGLCSWDKKPAVGDVGEPWVGGAFAIFDDVAKPTQMTTRWLEEAKETTAKDLVIDSVRVVVVEKQPPSKTLAAAFPGLQKIGAKTRDWSSDAGAYLGTANYAGYRAWAHRTVVAAPCVPPDPPEVIVIEREDVCRPPRRPRAGGHWSPGTPSEFLGEMVLTSSADYATITVGAGPDKNLGPTLHDSKLIKKAKAPLDTEHAWRPQICFRGVCATPEKSTRKVRFYVPAENLLLEIIGWYEVVSPGMYTKIMQWDFSADGVPPGARVLGVR